MDNPLLGIQKYGQSIWLDFIRRGMLKNGEMERLIENDGLRGVTVNPSILQKAIAGSNDYDDTIRLLVLEDYEPKQIYEKLAVEDVRTAADLFLPLYQETNGRHGFVSLEVSPHLAHDAEGTIDEARRFWRELDHPNVMIKVPATIEGLAAIERLTEEGINVNVTLLFGLSRYREVVQAYLKGMKSRLQEGKPLHQVSSVASFFLSRIDVLVDPILESIIKRNGTPAFIASRLHGQVAVASAKLAYQIHQELFSGDAFTELADEGARAQRLLWASTSTKNPQYSDIKYVEALIGPDTVNTIPLETLRAYRDHGNPKRRLTEGIEHARQVLDQLDDVDIKIDQMTQQLEDEGVDKFIKSYDTLIVALEEKHQMISKAPIDRLVIELGENQSHLEERISVMEEDDFVHRFWEKDGSLWKDDPAEKNMIRNRMGWLHIAEKMEKNLAQIQAFVDEIISAGFQHVVHIGMGGSSLAPMVMANLLEPTEDGLPFDVLDTTAPETIMNLEQFIPLQKTLFIIASKSGTTAETRSLADYYFDRLSELIGEDAGSNFIAITDPGSPLVDFARQKGFRQTFLNFKDIGGRYSALSYFGLVPGALMGINLFELLDRALTMRHACAMCVPVQENPAVKLGAALGEVALHGRDKVTFLIPKPAAMFGMWLEQLLAESTGKEGKGLLPVAGEPLTAPQKYSDDRIFIHFRVGRDDDEFTTLVKKLRNDDHPVITIELDDLMDIGQEFFRWEVATATAGSILGINAFDQPNVQESKDNTKSMLEKVRQREGLPEEVPVVKEGELELYWDKSVNDLSEAFMAFLSQAQPGDYIALMAYLKEEPDTDQALQDLRVQLQDLTHSATTLGYGPRFLHSTGQYHKGGPNKGLFLQLTADQQADVPVPGQPYTFSTFLQAQALGDLQALRKHHRRVMRIDLGGDVYNGLVTTIQIIQRIPQAIGSR